QAQQKQQSLYNGKVLLEKHDPPAMYDSEETLELAQENTLDPLPQKLENENVELEFQVRNYERENAHLKTAYKNLFDFPSNSVPTTKKSKVVENDKVIAPRMFRINLFKNFREEKSVPNKPIKASVRTNSITVSQPHVITKKVINSDLNGLSSIGVDISTKTRRQQPRNTFKNDKVPSKSKSSWLSNNLEKIEENHRNLQSSLN
ncbi:hypothetical protein Tco_1150859, partial [Tanacetum coccineum]